MGGLSYIYRKSHFGRQLARKIKRSPLTAEECRNVLGTLCDTLRLDSSRGVEQALVRHWADTPAVVTLDHTRLYRRAAKELSTGKGLLLFSHDLSLTGAPMALLDMAVEARKLGYAPVCISRHDGPMRERWEHNGLTCLVVPAEDILLREPDLFRLFQKSHTILFNTVLALPEISLTEGTAARRVAWIHEGSEFGSFLRVEGRFSGLDEVALVSSLSERTLGPFLPPSMPRRLLAYPMTDAGPRETSEAPTGVLRLMMVGTVCERKGHHLLLEALGLLPEEVRRKMAVTVVGDIIRDPGNQKGRELLERLQAHPQIRFLGPQPREAVMELMSDSHALLCPSLEDPLPIVCSEAMMLGRPVVVTEATGTAALIRKSGGGVIIPPGDPAALANVLTGLAGGRYDLASLSRQARKCFLDTFDPAKFRQALADFLR